MSTIDDELSGAEVSQVVFVRDYVQIVLEHEDRYVTINAVTDPEVLGPDTTLTKGEPGWRDGLCALIGSRVRTASASADEFRIEFDLGVALTISLLGNEYSPESVVVNASGGELWVF